MVEGAVFQFSGQNVAPFCKPIEEPVYTCDVELHQATDIYDNCTPTFYSSQNPATDCNYASRCREYNLQHLMQSCNTTKRLW